MKAITKLLMLILALTLCLGLFACGGDTECTEHKDEDKDGKCDLCSATVELPKDEEEKIEFIKDGEANFNFVISSTATGSVNLAVDKLIKELKELGITTTKVTDKKDGGEIEILIGDVSGRGEEYDIDEHTLGLKGYAIKLIGKKLVVVGGSDDALATAIDIMKSDFLGIKKTTDSLTEVVISASMNVLEIQDNYRITNISVNGAEINTFKIKVDKSDKNMLSAATSFQSSVYAAKGYWIDIVNAADAADGNYISFEFVDDAGTDGYKVSVKDGNLVFETEFPNKVKDATEKFVTKNISSVVGKGVDFTNKFTYTDSVRYVYYSEFKILDSTGKQDDFATIKACHDYANTWGHTVRADSGATYYIGNTGAATVLVKTDVEWGTATFKIDDKAVAPTDAARTIHVFTIASSFSDWKKVYKDDAPELDAIRDGINSSSITNIGFAPGYKALINVIDDNNYAYNRWGTHATATPPYQREVIMVEADGTIIDKTEFLLDYTGVTRIEVYRADDETVTVSGGKFITDANEAPPVYTSYCRGIVVNRANTVIKNCVHDIIGEGESGAPYSGFIRWDYTSNLYVENVTFHGHKSYQDYEYDSDGNIIKVHSTMGTYDLGGGHSTGITLYNCRQSDFFKDESAKTVYDELERWGIMGSNYCKNITYDTCMLTRLDAHAGVYNVTIKNTDITYIKLIGGGTAIIENCRVYEPSPTSKTMIELRADYGSTFRGDIIIKDCSYFNGNQGKTESDVTTLFSVTWDNWDFGNYTTHLPNVEIDNLYIKSPTSPVYIFSDPNTSIDAIDAVQFADGTKNKNPMVIDKTVVIKNNKGGYSYVTSKDAYLTDKVELIIDPN